MKNQTSRAKIDAYHKEVAEQIIKMLEAGTVPWQKPWDGDVSAVANSMPFNGASKRRYRGINSLYLSTVAYTKGYKEPRWFTFKQAEDLGGHVKRGEKGVKVEYWEFTYTVKEDKDGNPLPKEEWYEADRKFPFWKTFIVFNAEQCENIPELELPKRDWEPLERAETIIKANGVPIYHDGVDRNYYTHGKDEIHLTPMESFPSVEAYYGTALHELGHSTGHEKRLNRTFGKVFGDPEYAREELRAEIASYMLCSELGINKQASDEQHVAYVGSWIKALEDDPNEIFKASADAENICNYLYDREKEYLKALENGQAIENNVSVYPEVSNEPSMVADEVVAHYGLPNLEVAKGLENKAYDIEQAYTTNFVEDGGRMGAYIIEGKAYLGKRSNIKYQPDKDEVGNDVMVRYYDNSDGSLVHLSDKPDMAGFIAFRSVDVSQDGMYNVLGKMTYEDYQETLKLENTVLAKYDSWEDLPPKLDDNTIFMHRATLSNYMKDGVTVDVFLKDDVVYMGYSTRYQREEGIYDNSEYSLVRISRNPKMYDLLHGRSYLNSQEELIAMGEFSRYDFQEFAELRNGVLSQFDEIQTMTFDDEPFKSPIPERDLVITSLYRTNYQEDNEVLYAYAINGKAYLGKYQNFKLHPQETEDGYEIVVRYYDNSDNSLRHLSDNPEMVKLIAQRSLRISQDNMDGLGTFTLDDVKEASRIEQALGFVTEPLMVFEGVPEDDNIIKVRAASISNYEKDGKQYDVFIKNDEVFMGERSRYQREVGYDNSDYSLIKVSGNEKMFHLLYGNGYAVSQMQLIEDGGYTQDDFKEFAELKNGVLSQFDEVREIAFAGEPFRYPLEAGIPEAELNAAVVEAVEREINPFIGMDKIIDSVHTNFEENGKQISMINLNGELFIGYSDNVQLDVLIDGFPRTKHLEYYDNRDNSLRYVSDRTKMAYFIQGMSHGWTQNEMLMVKSEPFAPEKASYVGPAFSSIDYEQWDFMKRVDFDRFNHIDDVSRTVEDYKIQVEFKGTTDFTNLNGDNLVCVEKYGSYYLGKADNLSADGIYDNSDYSLYSITKNEKVIELMLDENINLSEELQNGYFSKEDFLEYSLLRERTKEIFLQDVPENWSDLRLTMFKEEFEKTYPVLYKDIIASNYKDFVLLNGSEGTYLGKRENILTVHDLSGHRTIRYDNADNSLVHLSNRLSMAEFIAGRSFGYEMQDLPEFEQAYDVTYLKEFNEIYDKHLAGLKLESEWGNTGRFDVKEAMKMADEQVKETTEKQFTPPSDKQFALAETLHVKYKEGISAKELGEKIAKKLEANKKYKEAMAKPASAEQIKDLEAAGVKIPENLTIGEADKMIKGLPATPECKMFMDRLKLEYVPEITSGEAYKLIGAKMKELEAKENEPASEKTIEYMKNVRGIKDIPENCTRGEADKLIYNSAPAAKQMAYITNRKIECDLENLTYGQAKNIIDKHEKHVAAQKALPATDKQKARLDKEKVEYKEGITRGEASDIIRELQMKKLEISEKQIKYANDLNIEIPENATKASLAKMIETKIRTEKIASFEVPKDRKLTIGEGYASLAKAYIEKGKPIDDKKIAGELLKQGHRECDVKNIIHKHSPNCVNDLAKAQGIVNEAMKLPSVKKSLDKDKSR